MLRLIQVCQDISYPDQGGLWFVPVPSGKFCNRYWSSSFWKLLHFPVTSSGLGPFIFLCTLFSSIQSLCSSLNVKDHVWYPYKTTGKITVSEWVSECVCVCVCACVRVYIYICMAFIFNFCIKLSKLHKNIVIFSSLGRWRQWRIYPEWWLHGVYIPQAFTVWWSYIGILRISNSCRACQFFFQTTEKKFNIRGNVPTQINCDYCRRKLFIVFW